MALDINYSNSIDKSTGKTWTFTDSTDYSGVTLTSITLKIWDPDQDPSTDTEIVNESIPIGSPNDAVELDADNDFSRSGSTLKDGVYTIDLVVVSDDADSPQTQRGYYYNVHNIKECIAEMTDEALDKDCDCRSEDLDKINKMSLILKSSCVNFNKQRFTKVASQLTTLQEMCDDGSDCNC